MGTRVERVVLELDDKLTSGMAKSAAATALLKRELDGVDKGNVSATRSTKAFGDETQRTRAKVESGNSELNSYAGRIRLIAELAAGLGPALIPIGAVGVPAVVGLADAFAGVALGAGTAMVAFQGVGTALTAVNKAALNPTVTNLKNAQIALDGLPQAAREFTRELAAMQPVLMRAREAAAEGLFPGLEKGLHDLQTLMPRVDQILYRVGATLGNLSSEGAKALSGPQWEHFIEFIGNEAPIALAATGHAIGSVIHGLGELWMAFTPLNHSFLGFIEQAAAGFDHWATGLSQTQGFQSFIEYLHMEGPKVADAVVAIGNAVLQIVEAAAPLGGPILQALTAVANVIGAIAGSPLGPTIMATVTALSLLSRAQASFGKIAETSWYQAVKGADTYQAKLAAGKGVLIKGGLAAAGLGLAASGVADKFGLANTATLALTGSLAGPWGAAAGGAVGLLLDMTNKTKAVDLNAQALTATLDKQTGAITKNTAAYVANQLEQSGVLEAAQKLGVVTSDVVQAALQNADAQHRVAQAIQLYEDGINGSVPKQQIYAKNFRVILDAIDTTNTALDNGKSSIGRLDEALAGTKSGFNTAQSAAADFRDEIQRVNDVLTRRSSFRDYEKALIDFAARAKKRGEIMVQIAQAQKSLAEAKTPSEKQSARDNIKSLQEQADALKNTLNLSTQAGLDTQAAMDQIAKTAVAYADTLSPSRRVDFLAHARQQFINLTADVLGSRQAAADLATKLGLLSRIQSRPKIYVDGIDRALARAEQLAASLRALDGSHTIAFHTTGGRSLANADGGTIPGQRAPYGDKVLSWVAPGEEVISNRYGQADQYRHVLKAINNRRYADGGTVAASRVNVNISPSYSGGGSSIDYGRLTDAVAAARPAPPLYGDVHVTDGYGGFKRQMEQDRAMASLSGVRRG